MGIIHKITELKKRIENNLLFKILICFILSCIVIIVSLIYYKKIEQMKSKNYVIVNDTKLINTIEKIDIKNNLIKLEGYAFYLDKDSQYTTISLILRNLKSKENIWMKTDTVYRPDINKRFDYNNYNYENSGYVATSNIKKLDMSDGYEIILNIDINDGEGKSNKITVSTNRYIYNSELITYNPYEYDKPDNNIQSELLTTIFHKGQLHFYRRDIGMYVYEYMNKLYWIATKEFDFNNNGQTYIQYHVYTPQIDKLPENRIQYGFDNLSFIFEENEIIDKFTEPYRVAEQEIPSNYTISYIKTGVYDKTDNKWLWDGLFQLTHTY